MFVLGQARVPGDGSQKEIGRMEWRKRMTARVSTLDIIVGKATEEELSSMLQSWGGNAAVQMPEGGGKSCAQSCLSCLQVLVDDFFNMTLHIYI